MSKALVIPFDISFTVTVNLTGSSVKQLYRDVRRESRRAMARAFKHALGLIEKALVASPIVCRDCHGAMLSRGRCGRRVVTAFGSIEIKRARYRCRRCGAVRRPLDEWLGLDADAAETVREQALYLASELPYDRAAEVLRRVGGIGISGRQIQRLLEVEGDRIQTALGSRVQKRHPGLERRFRRAGKNGPLSVGANRLLQLSQLRTSGLWDAYWSGRLDSAKGAGEPATSRQTQAC